MAFQSVTDAGRKFGSKFRQRKFDSYHGGDQPEVSSTSMEHGEDKVNTSGPDKVMKNEHAENANVSTPHEVVAEHGHAHTVHYSKDGDEHKVTSHHDDGYAYESKHTSAADAYGHGKALAYEAGGDEQSTSPKKRNHDPQQGAESEERGYEQPDLV